MKVDVVASMDRKEFQNKMNEKLGGVHPSDIVEIKYAANSEVGPFPFFSAMIIYR